MIRAILFDLDGTLIDSDGWHAEALNLALVGRGYPPVAPVRFSSKKVKAELGISDEEWEAIVKRRWDHGLRFAHERVKPNPVTRFCLAALKIDGYQNLVISNSSSAFVMACLWRAGIAKYIDGVLSGEMGKHKPDPELYRKAYTSIRLRPDECLAIEDMDAGVAAASGAGVLVWQVRGPWDVTYEYVLKHIREVECSTSSCPAPATEQGSRSTDTTSPSRSFGFQAGQ